MQAEIYGDKNFLVKRARYMEMPKLAYERFHTEKDECLINRERLVYWQS